MLLNDFYTITDTAVNGNEYSCRVHFSGDHAIFGGHFPNHPVVPGVCMMEIVKELLQQRLGKALMLRTAGNVKFLQLITPDIQPLIIINWNEHNDGYKVAASFRNDAVVLFKLDGMYSIV